MTERSCGMDSAIVLTSQRPLRINCRNISTRTGSHNARKKSVSKTSRQRFATSVRDCGFPIGSEHTCTRMHMSSHWRQVSGLSSLGLRLASGVRRASLSYQVMPRRRTRQQAHGGGRPLRPTVRTDGLGLAPRPGDSHQCGWHAQACLTLYWVQGFQCCHEREISPG